MKTKTAELSQLTDFYQGSRSKLVELSKKRVKHWAWLGAGCLMLGLFGTLSYQLLVHSENGPLIREVDQSILSVVVGLRTPTLNQVASDVTALGSVSVITLVSVLFLTGFIMTNDRLGILQLVMASAGGGLWMLFLKHMAERPRPDFVHRLVEASGYSYPSGHSLSAASFYVTFAIMAARHMDRWEKKIVLYVLGSLVVVLVALSRVYLGVHYASDVVSGVFFGLSWAFFIATLVAWIGRKSLHAERDLIQAEKSLSKN